MLSVRFQHRIETPDTLLPFAFGNALTLDSINYFRIENFQFFFSQFELIRTDGTSVGVTDTIRFAFDAGGGTTRTVTVQDNFQLASQGQFGNYSIGDWRGSGDFSGVRFVLGVPDPANASRPAQFDNAHPLGTTNDTLYLGDGIGYAHARLSYFADTTAADTIPRVVQYFGTDQLRTIELSGDFAVPKAFSPLVTVRIDYLRWFAGIDFRSGSADSVVEQLLANASESFTLVEVTF